MFGKPSLITRIAVGKSIGLVFGIFGFFLLPYLNPDVSSMFQWGILLWYITLGALIGVFGVLSYHPILKLPLPWWIRSSLLGGWMNFVLVLFTYDELEKMMLYTFGANGTFTSPFWAVGDGIIAGLIMGYVATKLGGEGKETIQEIQ